MNSLVNIPLDQIRPDPNNPRKIFEDSHIKGLAASFLQEGMINPIEIDSDNMIITGECRYRAAKLLRDNEQGFLASVFHFKSPKIALIQERWCNVPAHVNKAVFDPFLRLRRQLSENIHQSRVGKDSMMNPMDTAKAYQKLIDFKLGKNAGTAKYIWGKPEIIKELAQEIGISTRTIYDALSLLQEPEFVQKDLEAGRPSSYYIEAGRAPEEFREVIQKKVMEGEYTNSDQIREDVKILKRVPDLGAFTLERERAKEKEGTNRILNGIVRLGLALEALPLKDTKEEMGIIVTQLKWLNQKMEDYINAN